MWPTPGTRKRGLKEMSLRASLLQIPPYKALRYKRNYLFPSPYWTNLPGSQTTLIDLRKNMRNANKPIGAGETYLDFYFESGIIHFLLLCFELLHNREVLYSREKLFVLWGRQHLKRQFLCNLSSTSPSAYFKQRETKVWFFKTQKNLDPNIYGKTSFF